MHMQLSLVLGYHDKLGINSTSENLAKFLNIKYFQSLTVEATSYDYFFIVNVVLIA